MSLRDISLPPEILTMLRLWFNAVFRSVRLAGLLVEQGQFVRARMINKRISAIPRHSLVFQVVRLQVIPQRTGAAGAPLR